MRKKKKDIDDIHKRIAQKEKKTLSKNKNENGRRYSNDKESDKESDTKLDKKEKHKNSHSISSVESYNNNSSSDTNNSHKNQSQKSIKLKRKRNVGNKLSSSETSEIKNKSVKNQINENEKSSKTEEEEYQNNRHEKTSKGSNEKKKKKKKVSDSEENEDNNTHYKKKNKNDRNKLKRGRSNSSYMKRIQEKERKHFRNKKYNKPRDMKRTVSNSSNEFDKKKKKDKKYYQKRDKVKSKKRSSSISSSYKKNSDSVSDSSGYVHKMKIEKHIPQWERERYKHKFRRNSSSISELTKRREKNIKYKKRENERNRQSEEKKYDPFDEDINKDVEINENLIEYAKKKIANITTEDIGRTGGIYIPPFKLERLQNEITNEKGTVYQKNEWMKLKKKINNIVNKVNIDNIEEICYELFECNLIRGKGIFSHAILHAQLSSPAFTNVFTCLLCIVNSKFPNIGLLTIHRTILHFRRAYKRCDKIACFNSVKFIAHMINQRILNEIAGLQLCSLLLQNITNDSIQVCTYFLAEVGQLYMNICRSGLDIIFDRLKDIIQEGNINVKTQYDIEKLWNYRKDYFKDFPTIIEDLDIISDDDKIVHEIDLLDENINNQEELNIFREVSYEQYEKENQEWADISRELLDGNDNSRNKQKDKKGSDSDTISDNSKSEDYTNSSTDSEKKNTSDESSNVEEDENKEEIHDMTEQYLINLRKNIYLSIMSSLSFEECVHKLLKLTIKSGYEIEICNMLIDCCCMEKTFQKFYALQGERLCKLKIIYQENFEKCFENSYNTAHRLETAKLRNCSKFFAHLLYTDAISWKVFTLIKLTEEDTTSSTRIFIKILLQELTNNMGIKTFYFKINHPAISPFLSGLFPSNNSQNIRFSINFFTAIGLGALTSSMRKLLSTEGR
ncbi:pre-mRNA-splicing factor CWC22, putative [Plasmodium berghei]|uniref:Pre-mRNA-splicing factor CWC22, putative n=2 Tax=Plasmodium berghei TaxID=5821 RepID=A0A509AW47_PLABA|nr:pre-mRNA-splicing factor CWC22, putative [Plasmodium berghei ANKA]CXJ26470.1 pre-mRNA-splicing factor CWC22, putative [Plasmodium berghei]SCM26931.1 pre-mRNA-splicing factor CWC22, putative [Plasmodium berghei]SCO62952.1 pre-mRNA-splicing factor CWC22, putative [Plasmodium berghei]SCO64456.1 pre-mRNA-splicing factor CWC22, putative [Plasmodium berghei]VUC58591.1 pre-mRNA-splicing factor CWC22, putative [Plasmodium berghei ANKA]|eukprot:XP_034424354.1 pre-mRNA-splicing factor CWC22, putative [Plasmodium berghei ANKA]